MRKRILTGTALAVLLVASGCSSDGAPPPSLAGTDRTVPVNPLREAYFGDLHLHTSYSLDAAASGTNTVPEDAYRYAQGEPINYLGKTIRRRVPLDFLAVTDHAEYLGRARDAIQGKEPFAGTQWPALLNVRSAAEAAKAMNALAGPALREGRRILGFTDPEPIRSNWQDEVAAAQRNYKPGKFTTFVAFEWSATPDGAHLHRNVFFRGPNYPDTPFSTVDSMHQEDLWTYAERWRQQGVDSLLIPHNSNLSQGRAFQLTDSYGQPITREWAERRVRNEPLVEITQNKGTSETRPELSPDDPFAGFELLAAEGKDVAGGYVRSGLQRGLLVEQELGVNPMQLGLVGSSDFHSGASASEEDNFGGGLGYGDAQDNPAALLTQVSPILRAPLTLLSAAGLTGVWAESNTREAIFDALRRREVFATSGPRIKVRMFAGWDLPASLLRRRDWVAQAYRRGQPMGGSLIAGPRGRAPQFLLHAVKDPRSGNLDRIQIVKLWVENGKAREKLFDVAWSGNRRRDPRTGMVGPVGNTVDVAKASYANSIGTAELVAGWTDPDFKPSQRALYYARVIEIPTPRWPAYLAARNGLSLPAGDQAWLQERAWTSPVWYRP